MTPTDKVLLHNGSLFMHAVFVAGGHAPLPTLATFDPAAAITAVKLLTPFFALPGAPSTRRLLGGAEQKDSGSSSNEDLGVAGVAADAVNGSESGAAADPRATAVVGHWSPNVTLGIVTDDAPVTHRAVGMPAIFGRLMVFDAQDKYVPPVTFNEFWDLREDFLPVNATTPQLALHLEFAPLSLVKWQFLVQMDDSMASQEALGMQTPGDRDNFKRMIRDTNVYLLALTIGVTLLHSVFDMLAFKNDIAFWRNRRSMQGLSLRSLVLNIVCQAIILLYLFDQVRGWVGLF